MIRKYLLDTNAYSAYLSGDKTVLAALSGSEVVFMSVVVLGELYAGFAGGSREKNNKEILESFLSKPRVRVLPVSQATAAVFGVVKAALKKAGTPIPINDVWISAHAIENGAKVITYDSHFRQVPGLMLWDGLE